jgi:hypothetical protein
VCSSSTKYSIIALFFDYMFITNFHCSTQFSKKIFAFGFCFWSGFQLWCCWSFLLFLLWHNNPTLHHLLHRQLLRLLLPTTLSTLHSKFKISWLTWYRQLQFISFLSSNRLCVDLSLIFYSFFFLEKFPTDRWHRWEWNACCCNTRYIVFLTFN